MPQTQAGIYELVLEQSYQNQQVLNVFHYINTLADDDLQEECATAFDEDVQPTIAGRLNSSVFFTNIRVANLTGTLADFNLTPTDDQGLLVGLGIVSFVCFPFRYNRVTKDTRNGAKRFTGMIEENVETTGFLPAYFNTMEALGVILGTPISTVGGIFDPIILHKPADEAGIYTYNTVASVQALNRTTTQNSRKVF